MNRVPDTRRGGAGGQHGGDAACAPDPAGRDDGHGDRVEDRVEQRQQPELTVRVAPRLDPLDDDQIAPGCLGRACLLAAGDLPRRERATGVDRVDDLRVGLGDEHVDQRRLVGGQLEALPIEEDARRS